MNLTRDLWPMTRISYLVCRISYVVSDVLRGRVFYNLQFTVDVPSTMLRTGLQFRIFVIVKLFEVN